jgi:RND superfamily putative drug exporter
MFSRLADFIIRRYKLVIIVWLVVLFYAFPLIFKIGDVVVYTESEVGLNKLEAVEAQNLIDQEFAGHIANSTITIVIQNTNVTSAEVRTFSSLLYEGIRGDGALQGVQRVDYLYSALESYVVAVAGQAAPASYYLYGQVNQTAMMVFGIPLEAVYKHMQLVSLGYSDDDARSFVVQNITEELTASGADSATVGFTIGYLNNSFYPGWLLAGRPTDSTLLASVISAASDAYFRQVPGEVGTFALSVSQNLTLADYDSPQIQMQFAQAIIAAQIQANISFVRQVWGLGPAPSQASLSQLAHAIVFNYTVDRLPVAVPSALIGQFVNTRSAAGAPNTTMLMAVSLSVGGSSSAAENDVRAIRSLIKEHTAVLGAGYKVYVTGDPAINVDTMDAVAKDTSRIDPATVILVVFLVGLFFRSFISPWVPLMTIGMAYLTSTAAIYLLGLFLMHIHYSVMTFVLIVMLGAGTDYCIFIMSRYREERVAGRSKEEAVKTSLMWAGESIATSGATVMIGFGALMIGQYSMVRSMGMALVTAIGMTLAFALTMLPSLLMLLGDKVFWPNTMERETKRMKLKDQRGGGYFRKSAGFSLRHSKAIVIAALVISVPAVYLVLSLQSSYDFMASLPNAESKLGIDAMGAGFGKGNLMPTYIIVRFGSPVVSNGTLDPLASAQLEEYSALVGNESNIRSVSGPTRPFGVPVNSSFLASLTEDQLAAYQTAIRQSIGTDNRTIMLTVILQDEPFTTKSINTIDRIRALDKQAATSIFGGSAVILVGGSTASMADVSRTVSNDFFTMRIVVLVGIYVVLMLVLGSLLVPLRLILTVLLNVSWTVALTMLVFQYANGVPVLWMMPLILFVVAMGLGMDYDIFLTTRIREEVSKGKTDEKAIMTAVERTGGIITACGMVMAGAFGTMLLSSTALLKEFGFGLAFAILLDAMILRIYLVPAIMLLLQKWNWYAPGRLQRVRREEKARKN